MPAVPLYSVNGHPLLEDDALALASERLAELTMVAERLLGLRGATATVFTGEEGEEAQRYVAMQVSLMAAADPRQFLLERYSIGTEDLQYREGVMMHPAAVAGVEALYSDLEATAEDVAATAWPIIGGWRTGSGVSPFPAIGERTEAAANARRNRGLG